MRSMHAMPFGAELSSTGVRFRLWAPSMTSVELALDVRGAKRSVVMPARDDGWFEADVTDAGAGTRYAFAIDRGADGVLLVPDPASRFNPDDVHQSSEVV